MIIRKGYKCRMKADTESKQKFAWHAGSCRFVWNKALATNEARPLSNRPRIGFADGCKYLTLWKQSEEYGFLGDVYSHALQQALRDLDHAYTNFYQGRAEPPNFRKKFLDDTFRFPDHFKLDGNRVYLPRIGWVAFWKSRDIQGTVKNVTVSRRGEHWYVSFQTEMDVPEPLHPATASVGIDMGVACFAGLSDGQLIKPLNSFRKHEENLAKEQRKLSREVNRVHTKIADVRHEFLHKRSTKISKNHAFIAVENLQVSNMSRSAKGTVDEPGRRQRCP
jgi:putative transposase